MLRTLLLTSLLISVPCAFGQKVVEKEVIAVLEESLKHWNSGDVRGFMSSYLDSPEILFIGKSGVTRGHRQVLANYLKRYPTKDAMGTTTFSGMEVKVLGPEYVWVLGKWNLTRAQNAGGNAGGVFTLLLRKTPKGWRIIADHTS